MIHAISRLVAGCRPDGGSVVEADGPVAAVTVGALPGVEFYRVWGSNGAPVVGDGGTEAAFAPYFPGAGGARFVILRWPPETGRGPEGDPDALTAEVEQVFPGLLQALAPDEKGYHATDTVDMSVVLEGELWLRLEDGFETRLTPGSCVVLRGNRHSWSNRNAEPAVMASVFIGAHGAPGQAGVV
ncbi:cupin domain-containing protein [Streptomyces sp. NPDC015220]|uniref:cupin domain-containing protein n=1 Tax=Streptomyces sp. NPDC015220 TaxID=3364947 RepID=UPI0036FC480F